MKLNMTIIATGLAIVASAAWAASPQGEAGKENRAAVQQKCAQGPGNCDSAGEINKMQKNMDDYCAKSPDSCAHRRDKARQRREQGAAPPK